ncbi:hypothetical protein [Pseudomonas sp. 2023EL-01195]|nr:hypothetical protein [Pseudomonas sp. 2023EL-01195]MDW3715353.1 hypothetical protein [Pseudomonas sp. 2023EL-01195]
MTSPACGCPFHGLVKANTLTLPNGRTITGKFDAESVIGSVLVRVPGVPEVTRTAEEAASDAALGYQWRNAAALVLGRQSGTLLGIWGGLQAQGQLLYTRGIGRTWLARIASTHSEDGVALDGPLTLTPFGRFDGSQPQEIAVGLEGYTDDAPFSGMKVWDIAEDGSRAVLGWTLNDERFRRVMPYGPFAELVIQGDGQAEPFSATLHRLSGYEAAERSETTEDMTVFSGVWGWRFPRRDDWVPSNEACNWLHQTVEGGEMYLDANGIPSIETPSVSIATGTRSAKVFGVVLGYWYEDGAAQPVTLDLEYNLSAGFSMDGSATALTPHIFEQQFTERVGVCVANGGAYTIQQGTFQFRGRVTSSTTEELVYILRVGGIERDRRTLRYAYDSELTMNAAGVVGFSTGLSGRPGPQVAELHDRWVLSIDGETIDQAQSTLPGLSLGLGGGYGPGGDNLSIDEQGRFGEGNPEKWLVSAARRVFTLPMRSPTKTYSWQCWAHWWSNHLVCLLEAFRVVGSQRQRDRYGYTAYPGGVDLVRRDRPYPVTGRPEPLYGAIDPFTGQYVLGEPNSVVYI